MKTKTYWSLYVLNSFFCITEGFVLKKNGGERFVYTKERPFNIFQILQSVTNKYVMFRFSLFMSSSCEGGFCIGNREIRNSLFGIGLNVDHDLILEEYIRATNYSHSQRFFHRLRVINMYEAPAESYRSSQEYDYVLEVISVWKEVMNSFLKYDWEMVSLSSYDAVLRRITKILPEVIPEGDVEKFLQHEKKSFSSVFSVD